MATDLTSVQNGMDVFDATGQKIGTVEDVLTVAAFSQNAQSDPYVGETTGTTGSGTGATDQNAVLKVRMGGVLGIGATDLYIPVDAVQTIMPGESVTLNCAKAQCENLYTEKPSFLDNV